MNPLPLCFINSFYFSPINLIYFIYEEYYKISVAFKGIVDFLWMALEVTSKDRYVFDAKWQGLSYW